MSTDDHNVERAATRRNVLLATGATAVFGLAGCVGDDDETDSTGSGSDGSAATMTVLLESAPTDREYDTDGLTGEEIGHACGHLEFGASDEVAAGADETAAPTIAETHEPYDVTVEGGHTYVSFDVADDHGHEDDHEDDHGHEHDHGGDYVAIFTDAGTLDAVVGHTKYSQEGVEDCEYIEAYIVVEPDHGEVVVDLTHD